MWRRSGILVAFALTASLGPLAGSVPAKKPEDKRAASFPDGFRWGTAISGFQTEMGGRPDNRDPRSDWWAWVHDPSNIAAGRVSGDLPERGPGHWTVFREDIRRARNLGVEVFRLSIEWSRIFPSSTAGVDASAGITPAVLSELDARANQSAVAHYRAVLQEIRRKGLTPFVTLNHFTLPIWIHDAIAARDAFAGVGPNDPPPTGFGPAGWLDRSTVEEFAKYSAYLAWKFGHLVDLWSPLNEPLVVATAGYVNVPTVLSGNFPPGVFSFTAALAVLLNQVEAHAAAYDAVSRFDTHDIDGDGDAASVGVVHNMVAFHPADPNRSLDVAGAANANQLFNRTWLDAVVRGNVDANANGTIDPGEHHPELAGKADFIGVNYYLRGVAQGLGTPVTPVIPLLDFIPTIAYRTPENPTAPPCPSTCSDFGWEIYPPGLGEVLAVAGEYGLPIYVTENGIADADDDQRPSYLVRHLEVLQEVIARGVADVRGYLHWSLVDNFEWASGYFPKFGLYSFDADTLRRRARRSAKYFRRIARKNAIPSSLLRRFGAR
jgi:beta-galactosidase